MLTLVLVHDFEDPKLQDNASATMWSIIARELIAVGKELSEYPGRVIDEGLHHRFDLPVEITRALEHAMNDARVVVAWTVETDELLAYRKRNRT